jgi:type IV pilus secretin PilQ/predicted competence protein
MFDGLPAMRRRSEWLLAVAGLIMGVASGCAEVPRARTLATKNQPTFKEPPKSGDSRQDRSKTKLVSAAVQPAPAAATDPFVDDGAVEPAVSPSADAAAESDDRTAPPDSPSDDEATASDDDSNPAVSPSDEGVTETGNDIDPAVLPSADGATDTGDDISSAISPSAAGATDAGGKSTPPELPLPTWPLYPPPPKHSDDAAAVTSTTLPDGTPAVTLHMDNLDVRKALEILSRQAAVNILVSPGVSGSVTVDLRNVTVEQALQAITNVCNLTVRREKDMIYVTAPDETNQSTENLTGEMSMRVYRLNYAKGVDLALMIKSLLTAKGRVSTTPQPEIGIKADTTKAGGNSLAANDVLIVRDYEPVLKNVDRIVAELDVRPAQVLIEAVIMRVTLTKDCEFGINWAVLGGPGGKALITGGSGAAINTAAGFMPATVVTAAGMLQGTPLTGSAAADNGIKFGVVDHDVTGFIKAIQSRAKTEVLATPRLLVLSKQRAEIQLGDRLGFRTLTQTQTSTIQKIEFMNVGTQLRLRPFVSNDGMVRMEIHPERSSGEVVDNVPSTHTAEVTTNVMVPDGTTIVIGGLIDDETTERVQGIPGLMHIPMVGWLFRLNQKSKTKKELVVLLTPRIWKGDTIPPESIPTPESMLPRCMSMPTGESIPMPEKVMGSEAKRPDSRRIR